MTLSFLILSWAVTSCIGVRLTPLENNDKLQDISNQYVAEWQWESWPIKQEPTEQDSRSPGRRVNTALWKDSSNTAWYLFGGQPANSSSRKVYSDVWKYTIKTRVWERFFPSQSEAKGTNNGKIGGMMTLRANLFDEGTNSNFQRRNYSMVLCGGVSKTNSTKSKKLNIWSNFTRRKKQEEDKKEFELKSLAVYAPRTSKSNTVWQIDLKDKLWTAYVCCCDTANNDKRNPVSKVIKTITGKNKTQTAIDSFEKIERNSSAQVNESSGFDSKINKAEDEIDNEQQHSGMATSKNKKKKINQSKKASDVSPKKVKVEKRKSGGNETKAVVPEEAQGAGNKSVQVEGDRSQGEAIKIKKEKYNLKLKDSAEVKNKTEKADKITKAKVASKYCPDFSEDGQPVTWCDGNNEALITADISSPVITLWVFNLRTSHWSQLEVKLRGDVKWPGCSNMNSVRYAGNEEEVYMVCSPPEKQTTTNSTNPSKADYTTKVVYRINYKNRYLDSLSKIQLNSYFESREGQTAWQNDTQSVLQIIRTPENETILLLAYQDAVDLWILNKDDQGKESFEVVEKIWRGSALKWFDKYNAVLYNLQFVAESGKSETILIPNPRNITINDYWPRERGRFIIRIFKNENLKNQSFENRTREQNLTYELLQSDYKPPGSTNQYNHTYSLKVLVFFGISLAIFTVFGFVIFLKRCVNCPPRIRIRNECHKSPLVIRYSVIPDDLLYPVA